MTKELKKGLKKATIFHTSIMFWIVLPTWIEAGLNILNAPAHIVTSVFDICTYSSILLVWVSFILATMCSSMFKVPVISLFIAEFFMVFRCLVDGFSLIIVLASILALIGVIYSNVIKYREIIRINNEKGLS